MQYHCNLNLYILYRYQKTLCTDVLDIVLILLNIHVDLLNLIVVAPQFWLNSAYNVHMDIHTWTFQFQYGNVLFPLDIVLHLVFKWAQEMWTTVSSFSNYTVYSYWSHVNGWTDTWSVHEISCQPYLIINTVLQFLLNQLSFAHPKWFGRCRFRQSHKMGQIQIKLFWLYFIIVSLISSLHGHNFKI